MNKKTDLTKEEKMSRTPKESGSKKSGQKKGSNTSETEIMKVRILELENQLEEAKDKYLRLFSEFDNYRKRTMKERLELSKTASEEMIIALLPVLDDLERAAKFNPDEVNSRSLTEGISLIYSKVMILLSQKGVEPLDAIGQEFNTDYHEAITHVPANDEKQKGKVVDQVQKGYSLNGKVIRFARVVVAN